MFDVLLRTHIPFLCTIFIPTTPLNLLYFQYLCVYKNTIISSGLFKYTNTYMRQYKARKIKRNEIQAPEFSRSSYVAQFER